MLVSKECNGRSVSPSHIDEKIQAKLMSKANNNTAYIFRREGWTVSVSDGAKMSVGGIIGETRIRLHRLRQRQLNRKCAANP